MSDIIISIKQLIETLRKVVRIPLTYFVFVIILIDISNSSSFLSSLKNILHVNNGLGKFICYVITIIYSHPIFIACISLIVIGMLIYFTEKMPFFNALKESEYTDGFTRTWSAWSAINRILRILWNLISYWWVWSYILYYLITEDAHLKWPSLYQIADSSSNQTFYFIMFLGFYFNLLILLYYILDALFLLEFKKTVTHIKKEHLYRYIELNSKKCNKEVKLLKYKWMDDDTYYVVILDDGLQNDFKKNIAMHYKVINKTNNFDEAVYMFENIK
ncbi:hypothetical protein [Staphylococcus simulans]|uniref:hypothetical protein n=1 Tax=Staphylococcus simulans TaxID=1286 RepID=UPI000D03C8B9|nr:hypothetical protein [Staphylococcus simulans]